MSKRIYGLAMLVSAIALAPAAQADSAQSYGSAAASTHHTVLPVQLGPNARELYRQVFAAIDAGDWAGATAKLDAMPAGPLHAYARAQIYLGKGSPVVDGNALAALAMSAPDLPQAATLAQLAATRGVSAVAPLPSPQELRWLGSAPRRARATPTDGDATGSALLRKILPLIKDDRPSDAEQLIDLNADQISSASLVELRQRVAWSYYLTNNLAAARALAAKASSGSGEWAALNNWVIGLSAWRMQDWNAAQTAFGAVTVQTTDPEMIAAGHYWAARAAVAAQHPETVQPHLRAAARQEETFYGMLANAAMGLAPDRDDDGGAAIRQVASRPNVKAALALAEIGQLKRADELIRWQARIENPADHATLTLIAGKLDLPATQLYLAHNGPAGARTTIEGRYPMPENWSPEGGWRVDRSLVYAHALQESNFRTDAVSAAGARGLLQVRPSTAAEIARRKGQSFTGSLNNPATNMEYGQSYIEQLADSSTTGGLLPKVIAAYNAGQTPLDRWNARGDQDPLLFIESISYWETRGYVATVLRNYWMYQQQAGQKTASRDALVQGQWPRFPGAAGAPLHAAR